MNGSDAEFFNELLITTPFWIVALAILILLPACAWLGHRAGRTAPVNVDRDRSKIGEASSGAMLALLGLLLAFTFSFAISRAEERRTTLVEEVAAIGTAFLRADLLPEPGRGELRVAIADYARTRYLPQDSIGSRAAFQAFVDRSVAAQSALWPTALRASAGETPPAIRVLVANGVTEVLDAHTRRLYAATQFVPTVAKLMILVVGCTALAVSANATALQGRPLTWRTFLFAGLLALVMIVILDIERARVGLIQTDTSPITALIAELDAEVGGG